MPSGAVYDRPGDDSYQQPVQRRPYYNYGNNYGNNYSGYGGGISAPDPLDPTRRIYVDPRYGRNYDNNYAQGDAPRYYQRRTYQVRPYGGYDDGD